MIRSHISHSFHAALCAALVFAGGLLLTACLPPEGAPLVDATETETSESEPADSGTPSGTPLQIAVLPVLNTMPLFVAQQQGFFAEAGVAVELVPIDSARDRQIALQSEQVDGANTDLMGVILLAASGSDIKAVRHDAFAAGYRYFSIVAGAESGIETPENLLTALEAGEAQIAISNNTIIEYLTTTMLRELGYEPTPDNYLEIAAIPVRLEQLAQGSVPAATLPEPLTTLASTVQGGTVIASDSDIDFVPTVLAFNQSVLDDRPENVAAFLQAYERAVEAINSNPAAYRDVEIRVPDPVRATYEIPQFVTARVPSPEQARAVIDWMVEQELIDEAVTVDQIIDGSFLPAIAE